MSQKRTRILQKAVACRSSSGRIYYKFRLNIPIDYVRFLNLEKGQKIELSLEETAILMRPIKPEGMVY